MNLILHLVLGSAMMLYVPNDVVVLLFLSTLDFMWFISLNVLSCFYLGTLASFLMLKRLNKGLQLTLAELKSLINLSNPRALTVQKICDLSDRIDALSHLYVRIAKLSREINGFFELQLLVTIAGQFVSILLSIFNGYLYANIVDNTHLSLLAFGYAFIGALDVFFLTYVCDLAVGEAETTGIILNKAMIIKDERLRASVRYQLFSLEEALLCVARNTI